VNSQSRAAFYQSLTWQWQQQRAGNRRQAASTSTRRRGRRKQNKIAQRWDVRSANSFWNFCIISSTWFLFIFTRTPSIMVHHTKLATSDWVQQSVDLKQYGLICSV
jgi:hypothetical protein